MAEGTFPGAPTGFNARLSVGQYGQRFCRIVRLSYGLNIISNEAEAAARRSFYPIVTTGSSFTMTTQWRSPKERDAFQNWLKRYMQRVASNDDSISGYMTIECPSRNFVRTAVPEGSLDYGDEVRQVNFSTTIKFVGASDPNNADAGARKSGLSYVQFPKAPVARNFYPTGNQMRGEANDSPFEGPPPTPPELTGPTPGTGGYDPDIRGR